MVKKSIVAVGLVSMVALAILLPVALVLAQAQEPVEEWVATYRGKINGINIARAIALDNSGNVYITGQSYDSGYTDPEYTTVKYDSNG